MIQLASKRNRHDKPETWTVFLTDPDTGERRTITVTMFDVLLATLTDPTFLRRWKEHPHDGRLWERP